MKRKEKNLDDNKYIKMSTQAVVNTNVSSVSDINALRGNLPSGVYAYDMGASGGADAITRTFGGGGTPLADGLETIGAYSGSLPETASVATGVHQLITMTFNTAFEWKSSTHYIEVSFESGDPDSTDSDPVSAANSAGTGSAAFNDTTQKTITIVRKAGPINGVAGVKLTTATMLVRVVKRGLEVA
jgi:hypothetical protein